MKVLVIDRDDLSARLIGNRLAPIGHDVSAEPVKNNAVERMTEERNDVVFIDPSPLTSSRPVILNIRRSVGYYPYIILMSTESSQAEAIKAGCNDALSKPLDTEDLDRKIENAEHLIGLIKRIGDDSEDFPSAGGVIAKSAFNQLFLSAIDRADRYGERSFVLFISLNNYPEILEAEGAHAADYTAARLSQYLVHLRRQSDIIGQTSKHEYALLLQNPQYGTEPVDATNRFAEALSGHDDLAAAGSTAVEITLTLVDLPIGSKVVTHNIGAGNGAAESAKAS